MTKNQFAGKKADEPKAEEPAVEEAVVEATQESAAEEVEAEALELESPVEVMAEPEAEEPAKESAEPDPNQAELAIEEEPEPEVDDTVLVKEDIYSCLPTQSWKIGRFQFTNGQLRLGTREDKREFKKTLERQPPLIQRRIQKIDREAAEKFVKDRLGSKMVAGVDTTSNSLAGPKL